MVVQSHDNGWFYILLCDFQLRTKKFHYLLHVHRVISRDLAHHELTQDRIDCRLADRITVTQRFQPCSHLISSIVWTRPLRISSLNGSVTSLIFFIGGVISKLSILTSRLKNSRIGQLWPPEAS